MVKKQTYVNRPINIIFVEPRHSSEYPNMDQLRQRKDNQQLKNAVLRTSEYKSEYRCLIPRAPAFRIMSRHEVSENGDDVDDDDDHHHHHSSFNSIFI